MKIRVTCLYKLYNNFKFHVLRLFFLQVRVEHFDLKYFSRSFVGFDFEIEIFTL